MKERDNNVHTYNFRNNRANSIEGFQNKEDKKEINIENESIEKQIDKFFPYKSTDRNIKQTKPKINIKTKEEKVTIRKSTIIISAIAILSIALTIFLIWYFVIRKEKEEVEDEKNYQEESLIIKLNYIPNNLLRFRSKKTINLEANTDDPTNNGNNMNKNNTINMTQYTDFIFIIREKKDEKNDNNLIIKNIYTGYIGIINVTLNNGTNDMMVIYDEQLNKSIKNTNQNNLRNIDEKPNLNYVNEKNKLCFIKIEFYENGEIRNIYLPEDFEVSNMVYINEIIKLIIPKISPELYSSNIESKIYEIESEREKEDDFNDTDIFNSTDLVNNNLRLLNNDSNNEDNGTFEQYISSSSSSSKSNDVELRQIIKHENSSIEDGDFINLTEYSLYDLKNDQINFEENYVKKITYSKIDHSGNLYSIKEIQSTVMNHDNSFESKEDEGKLEQIYNSVDNMISLQDVVSEDEGNDSNLNFNLTNIIYETINNIELSENSNVEKINKQVFNYFDSFNYSLYNENNQTYLRLLQYKEQVLKENNWNESDVKIEFLASKNSRNLDNGNKFYGLSTALYDKNLYKQNLLGLKLEGETHNEMGFSNGIASNYFIMKFGNINTKFTFDEKKTNMNIVVERINQMIFKLIKLLNKSNEDLEKRNKEYSEIIIELEKNTSQLFEETFVYSGLFKNNLKDMYEQVQNFTGVFFQELVELINKVHKNYTNILNNAKLNKYETLNQILISTKNEYIKYIYDMIDILGGFKNQTLKFLDDIENELTSITSFKVDFLYDIIDSIYECKFIFKNFNNNLFKAIEKGIITFKYDIKDYIDEIIGDLLYITDFLSVNINKNEILKNALDEQTRKEVTKKLREFRDIILTIMDIIINNINLDYETEMSITNKKSVKYYSENKVIQYANEIDYESNEIIKQIKLKIEFMEKYEKYSNNIDAINNINNETIIELNEDIYKEIILKLSEIQPEYLKSDSDININKNILFDFSKRITNEINTEIEEINKHIESYSSNYLKENLYNIHYNLFYFRKYFLDDEMENLLNEFKTLISKTINEHYKKLIDNNYNLANVFVNEEIVHCSSRGKRYMAQGFVTLYFKYIQYFKEFLYLMCSDQFLDLIEIYFYKIRDTILNYIDQKVKSINSYYFNNELYKRHFYLMEQIKEEIYKIIDNINNYYNEMKLIDLQIKTSKLSLEVLEPYNKAKEDILNNYYERAQGACRHIVGNGCDVLFVEKRKAKHCFHHVRHSLYCPHRNNINKILRDLSKTNLYLNEKSIIIIQNFINKFDKYLINYVFYIQTLYNNLYTYYENKINNHENIQNIINEYNSIIYESLDNNTNSKIMERIDTKFESKFANLMNKIIINFGNNVEQIKKKYFSPVYLLDYEDFLEYPEELVYKTEQFMNDLKNSTNFIKNKINLSYQRKLLSVIYLTDTFIKNVNDFNLQYIKTHIKFHSIITKYFDSKSNKLESSFQQLNDLVDQQYEQQNNIELLSEDNNYDNQMKTILDNYSNFSSYFFEVVEQNFTIEICNNTNTDNPNDEMENKNISIVCWKKKFKSDLDYSEYNFIVVKLRTGLYIIKNLLNNIDTYFDDLNFDNILNIQQINKDDKYLNDKNILHIYNESLFKLNEINKEAFILLEEPFEYFLDDFKYKYTFQKDFLSFYNDIEKILKYNHTDFLNNATSVNNNTLKYIHSLLDNFNETLYKQLSLKEKYDYYNINKTYFDSVYLDYNTSIQSCFQKYKNKIKGLGHNFDFYNSLRLTLRNLQLNKRNFYKNLINDFAQQYDFKLLNMTYDLGEEIFKYLLKDYDDYEFTFIYDYFQLFYNNTDNYIKLLIEDITNIEKDIQYSLKNIYDEFKYNYERNISYFVTYDYIDELQYNYTNCINYSYDKLDKIKKEDDINYQKYLEYLELVYEYENCSNSSKNYSYSDIINDTKCINISDLEPVIFFNRTEYLLYCYENNYFDYKVIIFEAFNESYKDILDNIILNITNRISTNYIDEIFLNNYLRKFYQFEKPNVTINDLNDYYEDFEDMIFYINNIKNKEYRNTLYNSLIYSFNSSYSKFFKDFIIKEISDNITLYLNDKLDIFINYLKMKMSFESFYYLFLLNNTKELGITSKKALINLYSNFKNKLNDTLFRLIEEDVFFLYKYIL